MNKKSIISTILLSIVFCVMVQSQNTSIKTIEYTLSNAMGRRHQKIFITPKEISFSENGYYKKMPISDKKWKEIINTVDIEKFNSLPEVIRCEGSDTIYCRQSLKHQVADGDEITITIDNGIKTKRIGFQVDNIRVPEIDLLLKKINESREKILKKAGNKILIDQIHIKINDKEGYTYMSIYPRIITYLEAHNGSGYNRVMPISVEKWDAIVDKIDLKKFEFSGKEMKCSDCGIEDWSWEISIYQKYKSSGSSGYGEVSKIGRFTRTVESFVKEIQKIEPIKAF